MAIDETKPFSDQLEGWLKSRQPKTLAGLDAVFQDKTFAITFLVLMLFSALPIPTGGITNIFELIVIFLCLQMIAGLRAPWLPKKWKHRPLGKLITGKVIPIMMRRIRWFEERSSQRGRSLINLSLTQRLLAVAMLVFTLASLFAPPFSGLDTLPALGVVIVSLAIILDDLLLAVAGTIVGTAGVALTITLGAAIVESSKHFF